MKMVRGGETCDKQGKEEEEEIAMILFGEMLENFSCHGFDGSKGEHHVFADIFYGGGLQDERNSSAVSGASNSVRYGVRGCGSMSYINFSLENSYISSSSSMKDLKKSSSWSPGVLDDRNNPLKRSKLIKSDSKIHQPSSLRIVESFAHGILSSYYSVQPGTMDASPHFVDHVNLSYKSSVRPIEEKKVHSEANLLTCPVSPGSIAYSKGGSILKGKQNHEFTAGIDETSLESIKKHPSRVRYRKVANRRVANRDMPDRLETYAHRLLVDAGWKIEPFARKERNKLSYVFRVPGEGIIRHSLSSAWKTCGERLLYKVSEGDDKGREWSDVDEFWDDLKDIFAYIDREAQHKGSKLSLLRRWQLLDPFLAVVFINRKISVLRMGRLVRAVRSEAFIPGRGQDIVGVKKKPIRKRKSDKLSSKLKFAENNLLVLNPTDNSNNYVNDSPVSSDLESEDPRGCAMNMISENALQQDAANSQIVSYLHPNESRHCDERDGFSLKSKLNHSFSLSCSTDISLHVEREDTLSSKEASSQKAQKKSKKISDIEGAEVTLKKRRLGSNGKRRENTDISYLSDLPSLEESDMLTSECLEPTLLLKWQADDFLSTSEDESSHTSEIQDASSTIKICKKKLKFENKEDRKFNKDKKGFTPLDEKPTISISSLNEGPDDKLLHKSTEIELNEHITSSSICRQPSIFRKIRNRCLSSKESSCHGNIPKSYHLEDNGEEVFSMTDGPCPGSEKSQKVMKSNKSDDQKGSGLRRSRGFYVNDDDLLIAAIIKKKDFGVSCKKFPPKPKNSQPEGSRRIKSQQVGCRLVPRGPGTGGRISIDGKHLVMGARTVLSWLIDTAVVSSRDVAQVRNSKNHEVKKDGWVTRDGIICKCCTEIFSVSEFKAHAGFRQQKSPLNLYLQSGKSFTLCQLQAWSAEYKSRKKRLKVMNVEEVDQNDDTCGICGDGGELICCDNCPSTYHQSCLSAQELPEGSWYCSTCICKICKHLACKKDDSSSLPVFECAQCKHKYHGGCISEKNAHNRDVAYVAWFCGENCKKVFTGLRSRVGVLNPIDDDLSWTILRCNHDDQDVYSSVKIALMAECNSKLAIALSLMEECFLPMVDPRTGIDMVPHVLYNWGSTFARLNYEGFYTVILEKGDALISAASIRVHGVKVAEMPLIATCGLQRRQRMCRRLMDSIQTMLKSLKVEMIVLSAIPSLVETWVTGFGFSVMNSDEKKLLDGINLMLFPGTVLLQKKLCGSGTSSIEADNTGGNDQFCSAQEESQTLVGSDEMKTVAKECQSSKDSELEFVEEYTPSISMNLDHQVHESPPRSISEALLEPLSNNQHSGACRFSGSACALEQ